MDEIHKLVEHIDISNDNVSKGKASTVLHDGQAVEKAKKATLHKMLVGLKLNFNSDGPPKGNYVMDPLSCIPFDPNSDWNITNNVSTGKDQWWSRLNYEYDIPEYGCVKSDVIPILGAYLDLHPRATTSRLKNYGKSLVNVYIPTSIVSYLMKAVKDKTKMNIAQGKEIVDAYQGLTSFLAGASKGVDIIPCKMYRPVIDQDEDGTDKVVNYDILKSGLDQMYAAAGSQADYRVMGGVAFVYINATFSCAPDEISRNSEVPKGSLIDVKFKLASFHCLKVSGNKIKKITYKTATKEEY